MKKCRGINCQSIDGISDHSKECIKEHYENVHKGAGERFPKFKYLGQNKHGLDQNCTEDQRAAYLEGYNNV